LAYPAAAGVERHGRLVSVDGAVTSPTTYTAAELASLPQSTAVFSTPGQRGRNQHTGQGVDLEELVTLASPLLPSAKNPLLRVVVTVTGERTRTVALGELDPNFGDHPALLALRVDRRDLVDGPELVVPGDTTTTRFVRRVRRITVSVENPTPSTPSAPGSIGVVSRHGERALSAADLSSLPVHTLTVTFLAGTAAQQHTETGPTLAAVLAAAHVRTGSDTWVAAVGSDGYVATVTPAEATTGGRPLLISTVEDGAAPAEPRLITDGDVKGGRYVSMVVDLVVGEGSEPAP
jgi:hypothetical protein